LNLNTDFYFFYNYPVLRKTFTRPYVRHLAPLTWVSTWGWEPLV